jgi:hypothetical protein
MDAVVEELELALHLIIGPSVVDHRLDILKEVSESWSSPSTLPLLQSKSSNKL